MLVRAVVSYYFRRFLPWLLVGGFLYLFFFLPLARILAIGFNVDFLHDSTHLFLRAWDVLQFSLFQAALSTLLTLVVGLPFAHLFARYEFPFKKVFRAFTAIPFMLPTVVAAAGFSALLGPRGWINLGLMSLFGFENPPVVFLGSLAAIIAVHVFYNATIVIRIVGNAWASVDIRLTDAARSLGASPLRTLFEVTLPLLRPSILAASLLVFLFDFTSFGVILLLGGPKFATLEVEIYIQAMHMLNLPAASFLSIIQMLCTLVFSVLYSQYVARVTHAVRPRAAWLNEQKARTRGQKLYTFGLIFLLCLFFALPLFALPVRSVSRLEPERTLQAASGPGLTLNYYKELFINRRSSLFYVPPFEAARNSLVYASLTVIISLILGFPVASVLIRPGKLEKLLDPLLMLPLGASSVTLGLGYILTFNHPLFSGRINLLTSPLIVPIAHSTIALPFVIRSLQAALSQIPDRYREAAAVLGASPWQVWKNIDGPIISRAVVSAGAFAFTVSLGEFGAASLLARPDFPTLPTAIYRFLSQPGGMNYGQAMAMATLLMFISVAAIIFIESLRMPGTNDF